MKLSTGAKYQIKQYNASSNIIENVEATILEITKSVYGKIKIKFKVKGKIKNLSSKVFKSKVVK